MTNKKAQGLEMSTIILAVLGVVILLILFALITGKIQWFGKGLTTCPGECLFEDECVKIGYNLGSNYQVPSHQLDKGEKEGITCGEYKSSGTPAICCSSREKKQ